MNTSTTPIPVAGRLCFTVTEKDATLLLCDNQVCVNLTPGALAKTDYEQLECPITCYPIVDPVFLFYTCNKILKCRAYERWAIEAHFFGAAKKNQQPRNPLTNELLVDGEYLVTESNDFLKDEIEQLVESAQFTTEESAEWEEQRDCCEEEMEKLTQEKEQYYNPSLGGTYRSFTCAEIVRILLRMCLLFLYLAYMNYASDAPFPFFVLISILLAPGVLLERRAE